MHIYLSLTRVIYRFLKVSSEVFMQTAGLTGLRDLWGLPSCSNRREPCRKTTCSSFIHYAVNSGSVRETSERQMLRGGPWHCYSWGSGAVSWRWSIADGTRSTIMCHRWQKRQHLHVQHDQWNSVCRNTFQTSQPLPGRGVPPTPMSLAVKVRERRHNLCKSVDEFKGKTKETNKTVFLDSPGFPGTPVPSGPAKAEPSGRPPTPVDRVGPGTASPTPVMLPEKGRMSASCDRYTTVKFSFWILFKIYTL